MSTTLGALKAAIYANVFPTGQAINLVAPHDKMFVDCLIDLQTVVECLQTDNTNIIPQCSTLYNCGLTVLDAPRGKIKKLSVIDKIDPITGLEDATQPDDYCSEIPYHQVDFCHVKQYLNRSRGAGCCMSIPLFFGLPSGSCNKAWFPVPTDVGVPAGLPLLPLGFHYPQTSTDRRHGRATAGIWAIERGKIYIAPWIQSTETVIIKWDGIKRLWTDGDPIDDDPLLAEALENYVRWKHAEIYDHDYEAGTAAKLAYDSQNTLAPPGSKQKLVHQCREETRVRGCEPSQARSSATTLATASLFYNVAQSATAACSAGQTGNAVTVTIPDGSVGSTVSVADANAKAKTQAQDQAAAQLVCTPTATVYSNTAQTATASCQGGANSPPPDGTPATVTIPAGVVTSTVSQADADQQAQALAQSTAAGQLSCTFWNSAQTVALTCPSDNSITVSKTVAAHTYSSQISQSDADSKAITDATNQANAALTIACPATSTFWNTPQQGRGQCLFPSFFDQFHILHPAGSVTVVCNVAAHYISSTISLNDANQKAINAGNMAAQAYANGQCVLRQAGSFIISLP